MNLRSVFFILFLSFALISCVTVELPKSTPPQIKAENIKYQAPKSPYEKLNVADLDAAWQNPKNGNTISFLSSCKDESDPSLNSIRAEVLAKIDDVQIKSTNYVTINNRKSLATKATSLVDGYPTDFEIIVMKKNECVFVFNYIAGSETFNTDYEFFSEFLKHFEVL